MEPADESNPTNQRPRTRTSLFVLFLAILFAFVAETRTAQYLQTTLGYDQPYFIFYIVHSCFLFSFPVHLVYVLLKTKHGLRPLLAGLSLALSEQAKAWNPGRPSLPIASFSAVKLAIPIICITAFYSVPALLWFAAVALSSVTDVTAIWNANAFFAYFFSVKLLGAKWGSLRFFAVAIATLGVLTVTYGGIPVLSPPSKSNRANVSNLNLPAPVVGDVLTLVASVLYGFYQVFYKRYIALPSESDLTAESARYRQLPDLPSAVATEADEETAIIPHVDDIVYPPPLGLYSNLVTSAIGLCTLLVFWIPIPLLHYYQIESFRLPSNASTLTAIACIAVSSVAYNAGFMVLLGVWGPIVTSVGSLLTIVLTFVSDLIFGTAVFTIGGLFGAGLIVCAFGILVYDMI